MSKLTPEAQALLDQGRDALTPSAATKEHVLGSIEASLAGGATATAVGTSLFSTGKLSLALALVAGIGGGALLLRNSNDAQTTERPPGATVEIETSAPESEAPIVEPESRPPLIEETVLSKEAALPKEAAVVETKPEPSPPKKKIKRVDTKTTDLVAERELIAGAQSAIRNKDFAKARKLLVQHASEFSRGVLRPERQAALAIANCLDPNGKSGKAFGRRFLDAHANSPLAPRVRMSCDLGDY